MKKLFTILCTALLLAVSCDRHEDIWNELREHEQRIEQLEKQCRELNSNIQAIQTILTALKENDYVTEVMKIMENGMEVGYSLTFAKSGTVTIYHGTNGSNGSTPQIGIKKASDGKYYWTSDGEWLTDDNGNMIPATATDPDGNYVTPQFRVVDDVWYVSYDNGNSWRELEIETDDEEPIFKSIDYDGLYVYLVLSDGTSVSIPTKAMIDELNNKTSEVRLAKQYDLVVGDHFQLFYVGVVKTFNIKNEGIRVQCSVGRQMPRYFEYTPTEEDAGKSYKLTLTTRKLDGTVISLGETTLVVHPKLTDSTTPSHVNILIIGDSLTYKGEWAGEGLRRIYGGDPGILPAPLGLNATCTSYGTNTHVINGFRVYHEGRSGWRWSNFLQKTTTNPFYNSADNSIDFKDHAERYNNQGADLIAILMSWNGSDVTAEFDCTEAINRNLADAATLIRQAHSDFPNAKIICLGLQISSLNGGTGMWYGAAGRLSDMYGAAFYAFDYSKALEEMVTNEEFGEYCYYIDTKGQFDTEYNMPKTEVSVNDRNTTDTEYIGTDGVHPTTEGYYQIGDAFYRGLHRVLPLIKSREPEPDPDIDLSDATDLSANESANSYVVSEAGIYKFLLLKGNSSEKLESAATSEILWKSFGTDVTPGKDDLISRTCLKDDYIAFEVPEDFKEGNVVLAAKDENGSILWSWHIWLTDKPAEQTYNNGAGIMMDRNIGATCAVPGEAGALGLMYQWGRKDPFLGSSSISSSVVAKSFRGNWSTTASTQTNGTIEYATTHPTTFITENANNHDWYYSTTSQTDDERWTTSDKDKSIYDPCPAGWRIPDGGPDGVWTVASGGSVTFKASFDDVNIGFNFTGIMGPDSCIWYPEIGYIYFTDGKLKEVGNNGVYWAATPIGSNAYCFRTRNDGSVDTYTSSWRTLGRPVRCTKIK